MNQKNKKSIKQIIKKAKNQANKINFLIF